MPPKVREIIAELKAAGWYQTSQRGSHRQFEQPRNTKAGKVTVDGDLGYEPTPGTLSNIRRQAGMPMLGRGKKKP